ncbi:kin of IRRE-like protein 3 [Bradysia coprophila]|uniref:kin of IRRE-like protein 3 n=1 Tax=Bradysia coprophila TaxID=38358 RepID=UPI00187D9C5F|nr:kin of IRRE-like protein 3 [Bradysia coprophila]
MGIECSLKLCLALFTINVSTTFGNSQLLWESPYAQPYFDNSTRRDMTITVGQTANLHCKVRNLGDRAVSWIRKHDLHIITIGIMTYTNDQRFQAIHPDGSDEWILKVSSAQPRDSGIYECQVSSEPKLSLPFRLTVVVAKAKILANNELFFKSGSDINLTCVSLQATQPPSYIYWYKDGYLINYSQRGGINVLTERQTRTSTLVISRAVPPDSGNYTCFPSNTNSDSVMVHVIKSEHRAAMQHENNAAHTSNPSRILLLIGLLSTTIYATTRTVGKQIEQLLVCPIVIFACLYSIWR